MKIDTRKQTADIQRKRRVWHWLNALVASALALGVLLLAADYFGLSGRWRCVMTVGDQKILASEVNYFFRDSYDDFRSTYAGQIAAGQLFDTETALDRQYYAQDYTWAQLIYDNCRTSLIRTRVVYGAAAGEGLTLTRDQRELVEEQLTMLRGYAEQNGVSLGRFLRSFYGPSATVAGYRAYLERSAVAEAYSQDHYETDEGWTAWYEALETETQITEKPNMVRYLYCAP